MKKTGNNWVYDFVVDYLENTYDENDEPICPLEGEAFTDECFRIATCIETDGDLDNEIRHLIEDAIEWYLKNK